MNWRDAHLTDLLGYGLAAFCAYIVLTLALQGITGCQERGERDAQRRQAERGVLFEKCSGDEIRLLQLLGHAGTEKGK